MDAEMQAHSKLEIAFNKMLRLVNLEFTTGMPPPSKMLPINLFGNGENNVEF